MKTINLQSAPVLFLDGPWKDRVQVLTSINPFQVPIPQPPIANVGDRLPIEQNVFQTATYTLRTHATAFMDFGYPLAITREDRFCSYDPQDWKWLRYIGDLRFLPVRARGIYMFAASDWDSAPQRDLMDVIRSTRPADIDVWVPDIPEGWQRANGARTAEETRRYVRAAYRRWLDRWARLPHTKQTPT